MKPQADDQRILLILDLDETLIHANRSAGRLNWDFIAGPYYICRRPFLDEFLTSCAEHFRLAVWSSATRDYVGYIAARIFQGHMPPEFIWSRDRCTTRYNPETMEPIHRKNLKKLKRRGEDLRRMLIVDDSPEKVSANYGNAVYIRPFAGDPQDRELKYLSRYLPSLAGLKNVRTVEKRGWRWRFVRGEESTD